MNQNVQHTRRRFLSNAAAIAAGATAAPFITACSGSDEGTTAPNKGTASMAVFATLGPKLLPNFTNNGTARGVTQCFNDSLLRHGKQQFIPWLVESYKLADDHRTYTFRLQKGMRWSDGKALTAHDFEAAVLTMCNPATTTNWIAYVSDIEGAEECKAGKRQNVPGFKVIDKYTFRVTLNHPSAQFLDLFGTQFQPIPKHVIDEIPIEKLMKSDFCKRPDVSTGPFHPNSRKPNRSVALVQNDHYWGNGPNLGSMVVRIMDSEAATAALRSGSLDVVPGETIAELNPDTFNDLKQADGIKTTSYANNTTTTLYLNVRTRFSDVNTRRAILYALDRQGIVKSALLGYGEVADSVYPKFSPFYDADAVRTYTQDTDRARQLLAKANFPTSKPIEFLVPGGDATSTQSAQIIQQQLTQVGLTVNINQVDHNTGVTRLLDHKFDLAIADNVGFNNVDVSRRFATESYNSGVNAGGYSNKRLDKIMAHAARAAKMEEQKSLASKIQHIISEDVPTVMLYYRDSLAAVNNRNILGVEPQRGGAWLYNQKWRER